MCTWVPVAISNSELLEHTLLKGVGMHHQQGEVGGLVTEDSFHGAVLAPVRWGMGT